MKKERKFRKTSSVTEGEIVLQIKVNNPSNERLYELLETDESYELSISASEILITANQYSGVARGFATLG